MRRSTVHAFNPARTGSVIGLAAAAAMASCASGDGAREWAGTVTDSAGIRIVHNPAEPLWCPGEEWTFTDALTIGSDVGNPDYEFGNITGVQVHPDGRIFVFDPMASEIRVFDAEGVHIRTFGGRGRGPGEFTAGAAGLFLMDGDTLAVPDLGNRRIGRMSLTGEFLGSVEATLSGGFPVRWDSDGRGSVVVQRRAMGGNEDPDLEAGDPLVRMGPDGGEEMLVILPKARTVWMEGNAPRFRYFETEPSWDLGPSGTFRTGMTQEYRIALRGPDAAIHTIIVKPSEKRPVTDQDRFRFEQLLRAALERADLSPDAIDRQIDRLSYGTTFPAFNQVMEGPEGTTLVQRVDELSAIETLDLAVEMSKRLGSRSWDVFDAEGRYLGPIELPTRFTPMVWRFDAVYGLWRDSLDRPHVRKLTLTRSDRLPGARCS